MISQLLYSEFSYMRKIRFSLFQCIYDLESYASVWLKAASTVKPPYLQISGGSFAGNHIGAKSCADIPQNSGNAPAHANKNYRSFTHLGSVHQSARVLFSRVQVGSKTGSV